jgi:hypothetical protein
MSRARWFVLTLAFLAAGAAAVACQEDGGASLEAACGDGKQTTPECQAAFAAAMNDPGTAENARRMDAYRLALATSLSHRDTPDALLASAVAAHWLEIDVDDPRPVVLPPAMATSALLARAAALAPTDARVAYAAVQMQRCKPGPVACAKDAAVSHLLEVDADNAAAWLLRFQRDTERGDGTAARAALARAARAPAFRDYGDVIDRVVLREWLSDPTEMRAGPIESGLPLTDAQYARWYKLFEATTAMLGTPGDYYLAKACDPAAAANDDAALQADCRAIGALKDSPDASLFSQSQGRFIRMRLASDPTERERFEVAAREMSWLIHSGQWEGVPDPTKVEEEIAMRLAGTGDVAMRRHIAAARGLVFTSNWRPPTPDERAGAEAAKSADSQ